MMDEVQKPINSVCQKSIVGSFVNKYQNHECDVVITAIMRNRKYSFFAALTYILFCILLKNNFNIV
jgi:hypothetical protein